MRFSLLCFLVLGVGCAEGGGRRTDSTRSDFGTPRDAGAPTDGTTPPFPDLSPGLDLGTDLGPPVGCTSTADCDNGLACDGTELCSGGTCQPGTPVVCDDGVACTTDQCAEPGGSCTFAPNNSLCAAAETCNPTTGCEPGAPSCSETPCKLVTPQCGCGTGQACYMDPDGVRGCAAAGTTSTAGACTTIGDCRGGDTCISLSTSTAACHHFCETDADCGGAGALCILGLADSSGTDIPGVQVCTLGCEPASQVGCPAGSWCFLGQESMGAMRDLSHCSGDLPGPGAQGAGCIDQADCAPGYVCLDPGTGFNECLHLCRNPNTITPTFSPDCPGIEDCYAFDPAIALGSTTYGVCF